MATLDEASKCPRCKEPGEKYGEKASGRRGNKVLMYRCNNTTCPWGKDPDDMGWIVEVNDRGEIQERGATDKQFPVLPPNEEMERRIREVAEQYSKPTSIRQTPEVG
jgi:hypothetical protein